MHIPSLEWQEWQIGKRDISARTGLDRSRCFAPGAAHLRTLMNILALMVLLNIVQRQFNIRTRRDHTKILE